MQKTRIPWADYTINPIKGLCPVDCKDNQGKPYCYARRMYKRFHWDEDISFIGPVWLAHSLNQIRKPSRIFIGSTMELFGEWIDPFWLKVIFEAARIYKQHTFIFLTKKPENLIKYSPYPRNCYIGVSAATKLQFYTGMHYLADVKAPVKFISFEPLLESMSGAQPIEEHLANGGISWLILGCCTPVSPKTMCKFEWVESIVTAADQAGIPVFIKPPLSQIMGLNREELL